MQFCPTCGNLLEITPGPNGRLHCRTCPYRYKLEKGKPIVVNKAHLPAKDLKPVLPEGYEGFSNKGKEKVGQSSKSPCPPDKSATADQQPKDHDQHSKQAEEDAVDDDKDQDNGDDGDNDNDN